MLRQTGEEEPDARQRPRPARVRARRRREADRGERIPADASICKLFGLEAVGRVTDRALLVHGGIGYIREKSAERLYRDARLNWLEEGTPTIQQMVIAAELLAGRVAADRGRRLVGRGREAGGCRVRASWT